MGQTISDKLPNLTDAQVAALKRDLVTASRRMTEDQVLSLADALHEAMRRRRGERRFQRMNIHGQG